MSYDEQTINSQTISTRDARRNFYLHVKNPLNPPAISKEKVVAI